MSRGKLTRQELGWLLTQEAQGAAERLRKGVTALTQAPPPPGADSSGVDATLSALDDAMKMLSNLHNRPVSVRGRRGRIDLASLLWEVAPEARVSIEPGSGTEVFGDEAELRRMLHVMLGHGSGSGSAVTIRRAEDEVLVGVVLGPDASPTADAERAWLARMAIRYGGHYELEGSTEVLGLPAEGVEAREDVEKLRKELDEARRQGEAYARELAAVWAAGDEQAVAQSSYPPPISPATDRHGTVSRFSGGIASALRAMLSPVGRELAELRTAVLPPMRKSNPDLESAAPLDERFEGIRRRLLAVQEFVAELAAVGETDPHEPQREIDIAEDRARGGEGARAARCPRGGRRPCSDRPGGIAGAGSRGAARRGRADPRARRPRHRRHPARVSGFLDRHGGRRRRSRRARRRRRRGHRLARRRAPRAPVARSRAGNVRSPEQRRALRGR